MKRIIFILIGAILTLIIVVVLFISAIAKHQIEKNSIKYTGRQIKMDRMYLNPFTGYVYVSGLKIYEAEEDSASLTRKDSVFLSARGLSVNFSMNKLFSKTIEIKQITLDHPIGKIIQNKSNLNFSDLIKRFNSPKSDTTPSKIHFNILGIKIINGTFYYHELVTPVNYFIKEVNIESPGKYWNADTMAIAFSFMPGIGSGETKGNFTIHFNSQDFHLVTIVKKFNLSILMQYLKPLSNYGSFRANLDADINAVGNFKDEKNLNTKGRFTINDFHFGKNPHEDYASFSQLDVKIIQMNPKKHIYSYDTVTLSDLYFKYEKYDYLDNVQIIFGKEGSKISATKADPAKFNLILEIADYVGKLSEDFFKSDYKINSLSINNANLKFNDYSLSEKFSIGVDPLSIYADSIDKRNDRVDIILKSAIQPYGNMRVTLSINPRDTGEFDLNYQLLKLPVSLFNPYIISYTSFPLDRGTIEFTGKWKVRNSIIQSENHMLVIDPRVIKRIKSKDTKWLPTPFIMYFIRENGNVIDYKIPITGNLRNPNFHLHYVVYDILKNIFVKPVTFPYRIEVKKNEDELEKSLTLRWNIRQSSLMPDQEKFTNEMADFLSQHSDVTISVYPICYEEKEKEHIEFFDARKKYFLFTKNKNNQVLNESDSLFVDEMSVKDSKFVDYLNRIAKDSTMFTIQAKCREYLDSNVINANFNQLNELRKAGFLAAFKKKSVDKQVKIYPAKNITPYNGFSYYKLVYNCQLPGSVIHAYQQMDDFNNQPPRKKFKSKRENIKSEPSINK